MQELSRRVHPGEIHLDFPLNHMFAGDSDDVRMRSDFGQHWGPFVSPYVVLRHGATIGVSGDHTPWSANEYQKRFGVQGRSSDPPLADRI